GQGKFGSYLRLTPEQVEEYQPASNPSLTPPTPAQRQRSKYALTLAASQEYRQPVWAPSSPSPSQSPSTCYDLKANAQVAAKAKT
ncbi:hypothetical protein AGABI2DRAFT_178018, partial [Agaricus bisporus var. bisporus H97]|uniref:hypothetical protein n=1 Tax=Agaricus bisporus var. bisporus (strain H97 / ATCC MYA-4626 / FGSC 10389) TaxID=936046 RepID=UPI00029F72B7